MIVVDVETCGLDPDKHSMVSIGAVNFLNPVDTFYMECQVGDAEVQDAALAVNGMKLSDLYDGTKPLVDQIVRKFLEWAANSSNKKPMFMASPQWFDHDFIMHVAKKHNMRWPFSHRGLDLHSVGYYAMLRLHPDKSPDLNNDQTFELLGMPPEPKPHHALRGATWTAEAFSRIYLGKPMYNEFAKYPVPDFFKFEIPAYHGRGTTDQRPLHISIEGVE